MDVCTQEDMAVHTAEPALRTQTQDSSPSTGSVSTHKSEELIEYEKMHSLVKSIKDLPQFMERAAQEADKFKFEQSPIPYYSAAIKPTAPHRPMDPRLLKPIFKYYHKIDTLYINTYPVLTNIQWQYILDMIAAEKRQK